MNLSNKLRHFTGLIAVVLSLLLFFESGGIAFGQKMSKARGGGGGGGRSGGGSRSGKLKKAPKARGGSRGSVRQYKHGYNPRPYDVGRGSGDWERRMWKYHILPYQRAQLDARWARHHKYSGSVSNRRYYGRGYNRGSSQRRPPKVVVKKPTRQEVRISSMHERARRKTTVKNYGSVSQSQLGSASSDGTTWWDRLPSSEDSADPRFDRHENYFADIESRMRPHVESRVSDSPLHKVTDPAGVPPAESGTPAKEHNRAIGRLLDEDRKGEMESRMQVRGESSEIVGAEEISSGDGESREEIYIGAVFDEAPPEHVKLYSAGNSYCYSSGFYYKPIYSEDAIRYLVSTPPAGTVVYELPEECLLAENIEGAVYFVCKGIYYKKIYSGGEVAFTVATL